MNAIVKNIAIYTLGPVLAACGLTWFLTKRSAEKAATAGQSKAA